MSVVNFFSIICRIKMLLTIIILYIFNANVVGSFANISGLPTETAADKLCNIKPPSFCQPEICTELEEFKNITLPICLSDPMSLFAGRQVPGSIYLETRDMLPCWANLTLARIGQKFAKRHPLSTTLSSAYGFASGFTLPDTVDALRFSGYFDNNLTPFHRFQHFTSVVIHALLWIDEPIRNETENNAWLTSLANFRYKHMKVTHFINTKCWNEYQTLRKENHTYLKLRPFWERLDTILNSSSIPLEYRNWPQEYLDYGEPDPVPLNQFAFAFSQYSTVGFMLNRPKQIFLPDNALEDEEGLYGLIHLWALIGHAVGVADEFNSCLQPDVDSARKFYRRMHELVVIPSFFQMKDTVRDFWEHSVQALTGWGPVASIPRELVHLVAKSGLLYFFRDNLDISIDPKELEPFEAFVQALGPTALGPVGRVSRIPGSWSMLKYIIQLFSRAAFNIENPTNLKIAQHVFTYSRYK